MIAVAAIQESASERRSAALMAAAFLSNDVSSMVVTESAHMQVFPPSRPRLSTLCIKPPLAR